MNATLGPPRSWWEDDPDRQQFEVTAMLEAAPDLRWLPSDAEASGGWRGTVPVWPFTRPEPDGLRELVARPLEVRIVCGHAYPMVEPNISPIGVDIPVTALGWTRWHVAPDGSLCMLQVEFRTSVAAHAA